MDKARFEDLAAIASDKLRKTQSEKDDGFDLIQLRFQDSLQLLMSKVQMMTLLQSRTFSLLANC